MKVVSDLTQWVSNNLNPAFLKVCLSGAFVAIVYYLLFRNRRMSRASVTQEEEETVKPDPSGNTRSKTQKTQ